MRPSQLVVAVEMSSDKIVLIGKKRAITHRYFVQVNIFYKIADQNTFKAEESDSPCQEKATPIGLTEN